MPKKHEKIIHVSERAVPGPVINVYKRSLNQ